MDPKPPTRYAFIDVQNTEGTVKQLLDFAIDWHRMHAYLKEQWNCEKIFFYSGVDHRDKEKMIEYLELGKIGYEMRVKPFNIYKNPSKVLRMICPKCLQEIDYKVEGSIRWKSNCDAELSVDATNLAKEGTEFLILSGDGDFEYVIRNAVEKGVKVYVVSSARKIKMAPRYSVSRFLTKLRELIGEKKDSVFYVDIELWKLRIKKGF